MAGEWCQSNELKYQWRETAVIEDALLVLKKAGILPTSLGYLKLESVMGQVMLRYGFKTPRPSTMLFKLIGLSPGIISLWHDAESGFFTEARAKPEAPPVYHHVEEELAIAILKRELTHEQFELLMTPDTYQGE